MEAELEDREKAGLVRELGAMYKAALDQAEELKSSCPRLGRRLEPLEELSVLPRERERDSVGCGVCGRSINPDRILPVHYPSKCPQSSGSVRRSGAWQCG